MEIFDKDKNLIAIVHKIKTLRMEKLFIQIMKRLSIRNFNLDKGEIIENHIHNKNQIYSTSEAIVVLSGMLKIDLFDNEKNFIDSVIITKNDSILIFDGGHGIQVQEQSKFIEFKQGPYIQDLDKKHF